MKVLRLAALQLAGVGRGLPRVVVGAIMLIPLLYGAIYLWANWNPFGRIDRIPAAVVDEDRPVEARGQRIAGGELFVEALRASDALDFDVVPEDEARAGIRDGRYYFGIIVPPDFSRRLASPAGRGPPRPAELEIALNDANGFIIGELVSTAEGDIQRQANTAAVTAYSQSVLGDVTAIRRQLERALGALTQVGDASGDAAGGARQLLDALVPLTSGARGLALAADGAATAVGSLARIARSVGAATEQQAAGLTQALADATAVAVRAARRSSAGADQVAARTRGAYRRLLRLGRDHPDVAALPAYRRALRDARELHERTRDAAGVLRDGLLASRSLQSSAEALHRRVTGPDADADAALRDADQLAAAARQAATSLGQVPSALVAAGPGARQLVDSLGALERGVRSIEAQVRAALRQVPALSPEQQRRTADVLGNPVRIVTTNMNPAHLYGRGLAPFFFPIGLWVFGLAIFLVMPPLSPRLLASPLSPAATALTGWLAPLVLGATGAVVLFLGVEIGLGLDARSLPATIGVMILTAAAFLAIIQFLRAAFGVVGDGLALVVLMLQLGSSGGLYPIETSAGVFQAVHPVLPMSYVVDALRITISGGLTTHLVRDVAVLGAYLVVFLALTILTARRNRTWTMARFRPAIEL